MGVMFPISENVKTDGLVFADIVVKAYRPFLFCGSAGPQPRSGERDFLGFYNERGENSKQVTLAKNKKAFQ